jgi:hypothetical protein
LDEIPGDRFRYVQDMSHRGILAIAAAVGLTASTLLLASQPAQASEGIGAGRAYIHLPAPSATVVKTGKDSYRMFLPPSTSGQWMGERTNDAGVTRTRVGELTAEKLSTRWSKFRYTSKGVLSTLVWNSSEDMSTALVRLTRPTVTDAGIRFDFTSKFDIPSTLEDMSINLQRAPGKNAVRGRSDKVISGSLRAYVDQPVSNQITTKLYDQSTGKTCWGTKTVGDNDGSTHSVSGNCAAVAFSNNKPAGTNYPAYGLKVYLGHKGSVSYYLNVTPEGQATFTFLQTVHSW